MVSASTLDSRIEHITHSVDGNIDIYIGIHAIDIKRVVEEGGREGRLEELSFSRSSCRWHGIVNVSFSYLDSIIYLGALLDFKVSNPHGFLSNNKIYQNKN